VAQLQRELSTLLSVPTLSRLTLWDDYFAPRYGMPNAEGMQAVELLARLEGIMLDPVYTGKAMAGLIDGVKKSRFNGSGPVMFIHTGGAPALLLTILTSELLFYIRQQTTPVPAGGVVLMRVADKTVNRFAPRWR
jgi:1-aminocyclopropane-1-carboxylate deaminase/D-cysteine desulfhydrase-like pyridoxal-dependent ACC family enzyme